MASLARKFSRLPAAHAQHQRRAGARAHHAVRLVAAEHGDGVGALAGGRHGRLHGVEQVAVVQAVDQVAITSVSVWLVNT
jgi:hypothetical protein